jgi:hypothetical protein
MALIKLSAIVTSRLLKECTKSYRVAYNNTKKCYQPMRFSVPWHVYRKLTARVYRFQRPSRLT